jgi:5-methylcytosine-specific restriction endonuclease McrA
VSALAVAAWVRDYERAIVRAGGEEDRLAAWDRVCASHAAERREVLASLLRSFDPMGLHCPDDVASALAQLVAEAADVAKGLGWEPNRRAIPSRLRTLVYRRDGYVCVECGADDVTRLTLDHRVPVTLGGQDAPENLRTLCRECNSQKGTSLR